MPKKASRRGRSLSYAQQLYRLGFIGRWRPWPLDDAALTPAQKSAISRDWKKYGQDAQRQFAKFQREEIRRRKREKKLAEARAARRAAEEREAELEAEPEEFDEREAEPEEYPPIVETTPMIRPGEPHPNQKVLDVFGVSTDTIGRRLRELLAEGWNRARFIYHVPPTPDYPAGFRSTGYELLLPVKRIDQLTQRYPNLHHIILTRWG
jgi:predicted DNA-binding WGR domain protein